MRSMTFLHFKLVPLAFSCKRCILAEGGQETCFPSSRSCGQHFTNQSLDRPGTGPSIHPVSLPESAVFLPEKYTPVC